MITTLRIDGHRYHVDIPDGDRFKMQRRLEKQGFESINGYVKWLLLKYADDFDFFINFPEFVRYCIKKELKGVK